METPLKLLVCGDVQGNLDTVYTRIEKLLKKGANFEMLLCVGDFFGEGEELSTSWLSYRNGTKKAPIPTYMLGANNQRDIANFEIGSSDGFEFCDNITFLGKKGVLKTASGLSIAYLSGCESPAGAGPSPKHCFALDDVKSLCTSLNTTSSDYNGIDVLLTSSWPKGISVFGNTPNSDRCKGCGSVLVSKLAQSVKPRYHFAGLEGVHYERVPYRNHTVLKDSAKHVTRFIALAPVGNKDKQKYLYAFSIKPMQYMSLSDLNQQPTDTTECPYKEKGLSNAPSIFNKESDQYRWNMNYSSKPGAKRKSQGNYNQPERKQSRPQDWSCWFCLGGDKVEKHLVASVGDLCYVAMAKGGLTKDHVLILPIAHHASSLDLPADTRKEAEKFKHALLEAFYGEGRPCVVFERNYRTDHMQIQVVPLPAGITSDDLKQSFYNLADRHTDRHGKPSPIELAELPKQTDLKQILSAGCPFFHVELPDGTRLLHRIQRYFPLQFGREALCSSLVLDEPQRADWRACLTSQEEEMNSTKRFREFFKEHDFTLTDEDD